MAGDCNCVTRRQEPKPIQARSWFKPEIVSSRQEFTITWRLLRIKKIFNVQGKLVNLTDHRGL